MSHVLTPSAELTLDELTIRFGRGMPSGRIRTDPAPGTATEADVTAVHDREDRVCELIDGVLVEKAMGAEASLIAIEIASALRNYVRPRRLGFVLGADGMLRLFPGRVRIPDVSFIRREQVPGGRFPRDPIPELFPNLAVEVLSAGNTEQEMAAKLEDYFQAGTELVWIVDPFQRTVRISTVPNDFRELKEQEVLEGGAVLPGFALRIADIFAVMDLEEPGS